MSELKFQPPQQPAGTAEQSLYTMYRFLYTLTEQLNVAFTALDDSNIKASQLFNDDGTFKEDELLKGQVSKDSAEAVTLRDLIVKTAGAVSIQMDRIRTVLGMNEEYTSEWGTYRKKISREIVKTAESTVEKYDSLVSIDGGKESLNRHYLAETMGYIRRGIIEHDASGHAVIGIAIGQTLASTSVETFEGVKYDVIDTQQDMVTLTSDELAFWINGGKVAYMNQTELKIYRAKLHDAVLTGAMQILDSMGEVCAEMNGQVLDIERAKIKTQITLGDWEINAQPEEGMSVKHWMGTEIDISNNGSVQVIDERVDETNKVVDAMGPLRTAFQVKQGGAYVYQTTTDAVGEVVADETKTYTRMGNDSFRIIDPQNEDVEKRTYGSWIAGKNISIIGDAVIESKPGGCVVLRMREAGDGEFS